MPRKYILPTSTRRHLKHFGEKMQNKFFHALKFPGKAFVRNLAANVFKKGPGMLSSGIGYAERGFGKYALPMVESMLSGRGDYRIKAGRSQYAHSSRGFKSGSTRSRVSSSLREKGEMTIKHSEYLGELIAPASGSSATVATGCPFTSQCYGLNVGNASTFPWLASTSNNFQQYEIIKCVFEYRALTSESTSATSGSLVGMGSVIMASQYDSSRPAYSSKQAMEESDFAKSVKPSQSLLHAVECAHNSNPLNEYYVNAALGFTSSPVIPTGTPSGQISITNSDIRMQNLGFFQIAVQGVPNTNVGPLDLGEIWVHYEVRLKKPILNAYLGALLSSHYRMILDSTVTANLPWGNGTSGHTMTPVNGNLLPLTFTYISGGSTFSFPTSIISGNYLVNITWTSLAATGLTLAPNEGPNLTIENGTFVRIFANDGVDHSDSPQVITGFAPQVVNVHSTFVISISAPGSTKCVVGFIWDPLYVTAVGAGANNNVDIVVTPINSNIVT